MADECLDTATSGSKGHFHFRVSSITSTSTSGSLYVSVGNVALLLVLLSLSHSLTTTETAWTGWIAQTAPAWVVFVFVTHVFLTADLHVKQNFHRSSRFITAFLFKLFSSCVFYGGVSWWLRTFRLLSCDVPFNFFTKFQELWSYTPRQQHA